MNPSSHSTSETLYEQELEDAIRNGYKYQAEWKELYNIENPNELIKIYCK